VTADIAVRPLADTDRLAAFDCGVDEFNRWLNGYARRSAQQDSARTHLAVGPREEVYGYVALTAGAVEHHHAAKRLSESMPRYPLPVVLLARLAVDQSHQRRGVASALVRLSMEITVQTAQRVGVRGLAVDADNDAVAAFYERLGFARARPGSLKLQVPTHILRGLLGTDA
jgi:predicted N-acetyltransferase YhbS